MKLRHLVISNLEVKASDSSEELGIFTGFASVFNVKDRHGDMVMPGAFSKTLADDGSQRPLLYQHRQDHPIGLVECKETEAGLIVTGKLALRTSLARDTWELMKAGVITKLSIGYSTESSDYVAETRLLKEVKLWEVSLVTIPANTLASVVGMKSQIAEMDADALTSAIYDTCLALEVAIPIAEAKQRPDGAIEQKKGRVLNKRNRLLLKAALEALTELLTAADKADLKEDDAQKSAQVDEGSVSALRSLFGQMSGLAARN